MAASVVVEVVRDHEQREAMVAYRLGCCAGLSAGDEATCPGAEGCWLTRRPVGLAGAASHLGGLALRRLGSRRARHRFGRSRSAPATRRPHLARRSAPRHRAISAPARGRGGVVEDLPDGDFGISSISSIARTRCAGATCSATKAASTSVSRSSLAGTTNAFGRSRPHRLDADRRRSR